MHRQQQRAPSLISGSRVSVYSQASTTRSTRSLATLGHSRGTTLKSSVAPWYRKPLLASAVYTDLTTGAWHAVTFSIFLAVWTFFTACFDAYCLEQAAPGASHTGVYLFSYDFVYVGNHHIRNLLMMSALLSVFQSILLFVTSCIMLNALRLEKETGFTSWLMVMGVFVIWRVLAWAYGSIVNDMIFGYHIFTLVTWMVLSIVGAFSWAVVYSLYLQLTSITKIETSARMKMDTMGSSRAQSLYGSRPTTPHTRGTFSHMPGVGIYDAYTVEGDYCTRLQRGITPGPNSTSTPRSEDYAPPLPLSPPPQLEPLYASIPRRPGDYSYDTDIY